MTEHEEKTKIRNVLREVRKKFHYQLIKDQMYGQKILYISEWEYTRIWAEINKEFDL